MWLDHFCANQTSKVKWAGGYRLNIRLNRTSTYAAAKF